MDFNYGARHLFSDLVAQAFEEEKITLDNEENIFQAVNMENKDDCVTMYAYEVV